jgi:hypothetical protein
MINNARAVSDVKSGRGVEGAAPGEGASDCADERWKQSSPLGHSDGEGSGYEDQYEALGSRNRGQRKAKRESI